MRVWSIRMLNNIGDEQRLFILAKDLEDAAWQSKELANQRSSILKDVILYE